MKKRFIILLLFMIAFISSKAQIAYQVSLLNTATGEPRANVTVTANVVITDSQGGTIYSGSQSATTNDFGILSLTVGSDEMFQNAAVGKFPLFISVSVDGVLIGKSQILNVPAAEVANTIKSDFTLQDLCRNWTFKIDHYGTQWTVTFNKDRSFTYNNTSEVCNGYYEIVGNTIYGYYHPSNGGDSKKYDKLLICRWYNGTLYVQY